MRNAGLPEETRGPAGFRGVVQQFRRASPDIEWTVEHLFATGDMMSLHYTVRGTHEGELIGSPATGTGVELEGMTHCSATRPGRRSRAGGSTMPSE